MEKIPDSSTGNNPKTQQTQLSCFWDEAIEKCEQMMQRYWDDHPDIYRIIEQKKQTLAATEKSKTISDMYEVDSNQIELRTDTNERHRLLNLPLRGAALQARIQESHREIRERIATLKRRTPPAYDSIQ